MHASGVRYLLSGILVLALCDVSHSQENPIANPSFEVVRRDDAQKQFFAGWYCNVWEGQCEFRISLIARSGKHSALLIGRTGPKMRIQHSIELEPGRYRITAYLRGLDIGKGIWSSTTEFMFDEKYISLAKNGTFGWSKMTYVVDVPQEKEVLGPSFGTWAPGYFWVDDVTVEKVGGGVALTPKPILGPEEAPIAPPGSLDGNAVRCPECRYRNMLAWKNCFACGTDLDTPKKAQAVAGPPVKRITSFEGDDHPREGITLGSPGRTAGPCRDARRRGHPGRSLGLPDALHRRRDVSQEDPGIRFRPLQQRTGDRVPVRGRQAGA